MNRELIVMSFFAVLSVVILVSIAVTHKEEVRLLFAVAISADFYSVIGNNIGISLGYWAHPYRIYPEIFTTSVVYDLLFFPASLVLYLVWMPREPLWKVIYSVLWASVLCVLEFWLEQGTKLIEYNRGWTFYKTGLMYLATYAIFYAVYRWLFGYAPGDKGKTICKII